MNFAFAVGNGHLQFLFLIWSGVLRGCPLSGSLFAMVMDSFLRAMVVQVEASQLGIIRACADDVGAALRDFRSLVLLADMFELADTCAGPSA